MEDRYEIDSNIGDNFILYKENKKTGNWDEISEDDFLKLQPKEQMKILVFSLGCFVSNLNEDLKDIWKRIDKVEASG